MSYAIWYAVALRCTHCDAVHPAASAPVHTSAWLLDARDRHLAIGELVAAEDVDLDDAFVTRTRSGSGRFTALEDWGCTACGAAQLARLDLDAEPRGWTLVAVDAVDTTAAIAAAPDRVSRRLVAHLRESEDPRALPLLESLGLSRG